MIRLEYLSPTSISLFYQNTREFYMKYLAGEKPPRLPQTEPMAVGSAFDAYVKSFLHEKLFGKGNDPKYDLKTLFEAQVEPQCRDRAWKDGAYAFEEYKKSGALADLLLEMQGSISAPKFEIEVKGVINGQKAGVTRPIGEVPLLGKPDVFFINSQSAHVILDFKVNGFYSKYNVSPMQGYVRLRENGANRGQHKNAMLGVYKGMLINQSHNLEDFNLDWARQLCIYAWLCGEDIGGDFIAAIDQLVCKPMAAFPSIRIAAHRLKITAKHQWNVFVSAQYVWEVVNSNHIFRDMTLEDSQNLCKELDASVQALNGKGSEEDQWFAQATRG